MRGGTADFEGSPLTIAIFDHLRPYFGDYSHLIRFYMRFLNIEKDL
jgi:hypothetical protein